VNSNLKLFFESLFGVVPESEWQLLSSILEPVTIKKGEVFHPIGKQCKHLWFLEKGAVRVFEYTNDAERTTHFFIENNLFIDYHSVLTQSPSEIGFKAEEDCKLQQMPYDKLLTLFDKSHYLERLARLMAERQFVMEFELRRQLLNLDALQRYEYLIQNKPYIFLRFALKDIASYIGITPVSLSRLRKMK
jgi:CRP-like cAMP-binding protein